MLLDTLSAKEFEATDLEPDYSDVPSVSSLKTGSKSATNFHHEIHLDARSR